MKAISSWGLGLRGIVEAWEPSRPSVRRRSWVHNRSKTTVTATNDKPALMRSPVSRPRMPCALHRLLSNSLSTMPSLRGVPYACKRKEGPAQAADTKQPMRLALMTPDDRRAAGRRLRDKVSRDAHSIWRVQAGRADPIDILRRADATRHARPCAVSLRTNATNSVHLLSGCAGWHPWWTRRWPVGRSTGRSLCR
jgi:hypothetical protein